VTPEHAADIVRTQTRLRAERQARRKVILDAWAAHAASICPDKSRSERDRELREHALFLLANPDMISSPYNGAPALFEILQRFVANNPP
jgi:hypothetical protein